MIEIDDLSVSFGETTVLDSISRSIPDGQFVGLVGPNGAGKTTLLRATSGAIAPDRGTVRVDGRDIHTRSSRASSQLVSVVPQNTSMAFSFDVRHVIEMGRTPYRSRFAAPDDADRQAVTEAMARTKTARFADRSVDELSGGERQRVVLARALAQDTPVILLDEPTASLDVNHQVAVLSLVSELVSEGKTVVAAIHDLDLAARFCDELLVLADGSIVERGAPSDVIEATTVERAFETASIVTRNPVTGTPSVTAVPTSNAQPSIPDRIHVVGTGPLASTVLSILRTTDSAISIGPVPTGDAAAVVATQLEIPSHEVTPFTELDDLALRTLRTSLEVADITVVVADSALAADEQVRNILECVPTIGISEAESGGDAVETTGPHGHALADSIETTPDGMLEALATVDDRDADGLSESPATLH